jgi:UDP-N-acetylmuramoyl-L-alanyl-D-glutamate--2,6-diaminopimelate ligase
MCWHHQKIKAGNEQVITVVGCGGDRDKTKRPVMGEVACEHSDKVIFTSDNPRSEDPVQILADMEEGLPGFGTAQIHRHTRPQAGHQNRHLHGAAGRYCTGSRKGHEKYQEINGVKHHFDDKEVVQEMFELLGNK